MHTEENYSTVGLFLFYFIFNAVLFRVLERISYEKIKYKLNSVGRNLSLYKKWGVVLFCTMYMLLMYVPLHKGVPIFSGVDRAQFYAGQSGMFKFLIQYKEFAALLIGILISLKDRRITKFSYILFSLYILNLFLTGNKFSSIYFSVILALTPNLESIVKSYSGKSVRRKFKPLFVGIVFFCIFSYIFVSHVLTYYSFLGSNYDILTQYLLPRIFASQSELWWASWYDFMQGNILSYEQFYKEISSFIVHVDAYDTGMYFLMLHHGGEKAYGFIQWGFVYTGGYPAILLYMMPLSVAYFLQIPLSRIFSLIFKFFSESIGRVELVKMFLYFEILRGFFSMYFMGNIDAFLNKRRIFFVLILMFLYFRKMIVNRNLNSPT
ncbi:DUF6418 domain-containing protein [Carboxylicivirga sp. N1Y90]|uniref:DUF6418 domain-containing protein n=1 Tax=Carboxylicivirga fragile TaxID=3417571 RepID=UPI003D33DC54|nr:hypothetical protein [Marinilabiliaceae bacterium N1Y90]